MEATPLPKRLIEAGITKSYAYMLASGTREPSLPLALWLFENHGIVLPRLAGKTAEQIAVLRQMYPPQAPGARKAA